MSLRCHAVAVTLVALLVGGRPLPGQADLGSSRNDTSRAIVPHASGPAIGADRLGIGPVSLADTVRRPRAIEYSDMYYTRLTIHRWASYAELPLFAAEWIVGQRLLNEQTTTTVPFGEDRDSPLRSAHQAIASGLGALFAVNTVTGLWNLYESRREPAGRVRRIIHSLAMLTADAGFVYTASVAGDARRTTTGVNTHRSAAIASMGIATASTLMMWFWKN